MKVLSFLGPTAYKDTTYSYQGKEFKTRFFVEALPHFFSDIDSILVFVTPTVEKHDNLRELRTRLGDFLHPVPIPETHTEESLWEIFDILTQEVETGESVLFDMTNSYRSLPFLVFLVAAFLRTAKQVKVEGVLYGAFEAKSDNNISPVFDLTPFVNLLDWLTATNQFIYTGDARYLASQLARMDDDALKPLITGVNDISLGLRLLRPMDVSRASEKLPEILEGISAGIPKPFEVLTRRIEESYSQFRCEDSEGAKECLESQLRMINWYHKRQHTVHTIALCREWAVSLLCMYFEVDAWNKYERSDMELLLNGGVYKDKYGNIIKESPRLERWKNIPYGKRLRKLWNSQPYLLANLRNDVLHTAFRKNPKSAQAIVKQTEQIVVEVNEIAKLWNLGKN
ncbi:MAG: TIGR02221 family CRISPR-associated protein [Chloroflexi bacterium]|nr:MAG: TIGR02221 family CRISPR-associated protein [Chloroflexota bacterium]